MNLLMNRGMAFLRRLHRSTVVFPVAVLAAAGLIAISEAAYTQSKTTMDTLVQMGVARLNVYAVLRRTADAESGQRGYLITNRPEYLEPFNEAYKDLDQALSSLSEHYRRLGDLEAQRELALLDTAVRAKLGEMTEVLKQHAAGRGARGMDLMMSNIGRDQMVLIREQAELLLARENNRVATGLSKIYDTLLLNRIGVAAMTALCLMALGMFLRQSRALDRQQAEQQRLVQAERDLLEIEVRRRTEQLTELAKHLQSAREDERSRLARELHDELGALLTAAKLDAARIKPRLSQAAPEAMERLSHLTQTLNSGIALKRRIIEDLHPSSLNNLGLVAALEIQAREFGERCNVEVQVDLQPVPLSKSAQLTVYRLVQEAFTNIAKYARAGHVRVRLAPQGRLACVEVEDDGVGFDVERQPRSSHGLLGMRYRVESEGGELRIRSTPGDGAVVSASLPLATSVSALEPAAESEAGGSDRSAPQS
jgi:signal transduction histidine kinase